MTVDEAVRSYAQRENAMVMAPFIRMVEEKVVQRVRLRAVKKWAEADAVRDELKGFGFTLAEDKHGVRISVAGTSYGWYVTTDLKMLTQRSRVRSGFVPYDGPPIDIEAEAEWYWNRESN